MKTLKLGRLVKLDLRTAWNNEASDFTPWLAADENVRLLGDTLGLDLEVEQQEAQVGPFRADILCRNTADSSLVLVENQLERTDHKHLGQLFTYAAGLDAVTVIWIASRFTEEHRAALDWLNRITHDGFHFFGLEIELWRIGESEPAPKFNVVAKPNDWSKVVAEARTGGATLTPAQQKQLQFWAEFGQTIDQKNSHWKVPKPQPAAWLTYGIGRSGFALLPVISVSADSVSVKLVISLTDAAAYYHLLQQDRPAIEAALGFPLTWQEKPGKKECAIEVSRTGDLSQEAGRLVLIEWMLKTMDAFDQVFRPRIKTLDAGEWTPDVPEELES